MPFKLNQDRRRHIPKQKHKLMNSLGALLRSWREYDASLRQRGSLTVWFSDVAIEGWRAQPRTTQGGQPVLSIKTCNGPGGTCAGWITGNATARRLPVVWSGAESVKPINVSTDVIRPSVCRSANLNAVRSIRLV